MADPQVVKELIAQLAHLESALQMTPDLAPTAELRREAEAAIANYWKHKTPFLQAIDDFEKSSNQTLQEIEASLAQSRQRLQEVEKKKKQLPTGPTATIPANLTRTLENELLEAMGYLVPSKQPVRHDYKRHIEDWAASNLLSGAANSAETPAAVPESSTQPASVFALWADWSSASTPSTPPAAAGSGRRQYERMESWLFSSAASLAADPPNSEKR